MQFLPADVYFPVRTMETKRQERNGTFIPFQNAAGGRE
jgi:hypothetical protein